MNMWGDIEGARELDASKNNPLSLLLFEITGPLQIQVPNDKWKELLKFYNILVHLDPESNDVVATACDAMARNAVSSSNLSALCIHVTKMMNGIINFLHQENKKEELKKKESTIQIEGKIRATCGALNLLRILTHATLVSISKSTTSANPNDAFEMSFTYQSKNVIHDLLLSLLKGLSTIPLDVGYDAILLSLNYLLLLLSTQLYSNNSKHYFLEKFMTLDTTVVATVIHSCLLWVIQRPKPLNKQSISHHYVDVLSIMSHRHQRQQHHHHINEEIVYACSNDQLQEQDDALVQQHSHESILLDATRGVLKVSSTILLLPFRLLSLAFRLLALSASQNSKRLMNSSNSSQDQNSSKTIVWITSSPIADFGSSLLLLLLHNHRHKNQSNPFRAFLHEFKDRRWSSNPPQQQHELQLSSTITVNFENLFTAFSTNVHNELGALLFYTLLQCSPEFHSSITVRFDLDFLVLPLLQTLYHSTNSNYNMATTPFRSQSQLYLILILLLIFSQYSSFGTDSFKRIILSTVLWYKERSLKDISLGSLILLVLLRTLVFNLQRLNDSFLFSNSSAILLNLSPYMSQLHSYTSMRLVNVLLSIIKRFASLEKDNNTAVYEMYQDASYSLLQITTQCLRSDVVDTNLELVYALLHSQVDFQEVISSNSDNPVMKSKEALFISNIIKHVDGIIRKGEDDAIPISAVHAMELLQKSSNNVVDYVKTLEDKSKLREQESSNFTFIYEEDLNPEVFFVPYAWEVIVNVVTNSFVEWKSDDIILFVDNKRKKDDSEKKFNSDMNDIV